MLTWQVCHVAFWDDVTLASFELQGVVPDPESRRVGLWRIVVVKNLPFEDQRRNGKIPKVSPPPHQTMWIRN